MNVYQFTPGHDRLDNLWHGGASNNFGIQKCVCFVTPQEVYNAVMLLCVLSCVKKEILRPTHKGCFFVVFILGSAH